jgi:hypothetical protein
MGPDLLMISQYLWHAFLTLNVFTFNNQIIFYVMATSKNKDSKSKGKESQDENGHDLSAGTSGSSDRNEERAGKNEQAGRGFRSETGTGDRERRPTAENRSRNESERDERYRDDARQGGRSAYNRFGDEEDNRERDWDERGYSRNWDTLSNDQYGQLTQGSYNPRNNPGFHDDEDEYQRSGRGRHPREREWGQQGHYNRDRDDDSSRDRNRDEYRGDDVHREPRSRHDSGRGSEGGYEERNTGRGDLRGTGRNRQRDEQYREEDYQRPRNPNNNVYGTRQFEDERYSSHWHTGNQDVHRNQAGQYSDYENPPFDRDEYRQRSSGLSRPEESRRFENYGAEFDNPYEEGNRMKEAPYGRRESARERGHHRGYQYGTDSYNSGTTRDNASLNEGRMWRPGVYDNDNRENGSGRPGGRANRDENAEYMNNSDDRFNRAENEFRMDENERRKGRRNNRGNSGKSERRR